MTEIRINRLLLVLSLFALPTPLRVRAQTGEITGLVAGANVAFVRARSDSTPRGTGAVVGGMLGVSITSRTIVYIDFDVGAVRDTTTRMLAHADLVGRLLLGRVWRWIPYAEVGFAARGTELSDSRDLLGTGLMLGLGGELPLRPGRNLDIALVYWRGAGDDVREESRTIASDVSTTARTLRVRFGSRWRAPTRASARR